MAHAQQHSIGFAITLLLGFFALTASASATTVMISSISPVSASPLKSVTVTGTHFSTTTTNRVSLGSLTSSSTVNSAGTKLTFLVPRNASPGSYALSVVSDAARSNALQFNVLPAVPICTLSLTPSSITTGSAAKLSWISFFASAGHIDFVGDVAPTEVATGSRIVNPLLSTTYIAQFTGSAGSGTCSKTLAVTSPLLSLSADSTSLPYNASTLITWNAPSMISCSLSGPGITEVSSISGSVSTDPLTSDSIYTLACQDALGVSHSQSLAIAVAAQILPHAGIISPASDTRLNGERITLVAWASDPAGISSVQFSLDGDPIGAPISSPPFSTSWDSSATPDGSHVITATVTGLDGSSATSPGNTVTIDTTGPVISNGSLAVDPTSGGRSTVLSVSTDETAMCRYSNTADSSYETMTPFTVSSGLMHSSKLFNIHDQMSHTYYVKCVDSSGNLDTDDYPVSYGGGMDTTSATPPQDSSSPMPSADIPSSPAPQASSATTLSTSGPLRDLTLGSSGGDVMSLQNFLIGVGLLDTGSNSGYFGILTRRAVSAYQSAHSIAPATGYVGVITRSVMSGGIPPLRQPYRPVTTTITIARRPSIAPIVKGPFTHTLKMGSSDSQVATLQKLLLSLSGSYPIFPFGQVTGEYDAATERAVERFQLQYGVLVSSSDPEYGTVGAQSRAKLNSLAAGL